MRVQYRINGAIITLILLLSATVFMFSRENWQELWVGLAFSSAFSVGMLIYIKSNRTEKKRLQKEKEKKKQGRSNQHKDKKK